MLRREKLRLYQKVLSNDISYSALFVRGLIHRAFTPKFSEILPEPGRKAAFVIALP
ncbi:hypothetical protein [Nodularia sp. UHCC 0506]|uniref:hypothetical protein n=1 Tax=Nodularia sp. UHCC 0506 TaxID=3110243 RepID=UPI002B20FEB6|nr:hypothetical protein [Nodularia sp. UHCC 0506]MEA5513812.1 hypothetical protein [Nodularia sp. UHCC 0506]